MPIRLFTGLPGNGKTVLLVEDLIKEATKKEPRPIWQHGIDGLIEGLATRLQDATQWNAHDPDGEPTCDCHQTGELHAHVIPDGAIIYMDEAWKNFGHLQDASRQATPKHVLALAEHRHRGIDFVWSTQMPNQLFPFARALVAGHSHVVRRYGTQFIDVFTWEELNDDVKSASKREAASKTTRMLPKEVFDKYKSATLHTIKRKLPLKLFVLPIALVLALAAGYFAYQHLKPSAVAAQGDAIPNEDGAAGPSGVAKGAPVVPLTLEEYVAKLTPRIATMPWSAPAFDEREVASEPDLICAKAGAGLDANGDHRAASCSCFTEQGTPYPLDLAICRMTADKGRPYNPFKAPERESRQQQRPAQENARGKDGPREVALEAPIMPAYGDLGERDITAADGGTIDM